MLALKGEIKINNNNTIDKRDRDSLESKPYLKVSLQFTANNIKIKRSIYVSIFNVGTHFLAHQIETVHAPVSTSQ